ncbi:PREDICTED: uncharacterized protein LOC108366215 [Rhagoletis zephyria]|uniref:uncharacterized protein LOC108366215 n=1 Tax=Rhagoletis zephyria TaxID=28612 RepID=UPI0008114CBD|nr:PREDICTED: uncharacterized protein LOC108366215 [Rhagoletis zephyria]
MTSRISPISDIETLSKCARRFRATLSPIREEEESACDLCKKDHRLVTCIKYTNMNIHEKYNPMFNVQWKTPFFPSRPPKIQHQGGHKTPEKRKKTHAPPANAKIPSLLAKQTLIPTAIVRLKQDGICHKVRPLINPTQKFTTVAHDLVKKLIVYATCNWCNSLISKDLPKQPYERDLSGEVKNRFDHLVLVYPLILRSGVFNPDNGMVVAQNTVFGWTLTLTSLLNDFNQFKLTELYMYIHPTNFKFIRRYCKAAAMFIPNKHIPALSSYTPKSEGRIMKE